MGFQVLFWEADIPVSVLEVGSDTCVVCVVFEF